MLMAWEVSDLGNHDRGKLRCATEGEALRVVVALSAATHGRWSAYRLLADGALTEHLGVWADGVAEIKDEE